MTPTPSIIPLSPHVRRSLSAAHDLASYEHVVEGLLRNTLDANPDCIDIDLKISQSYISVRDDGVGIQQEEFTEDGYLAQAFCMK